ncbi:uncharacterized protein LOC126035369 [Accipiter gentilis]|uniref:uncharacterized protein LOC126035369 n=1 Tax=Astur gentilis TaxID=8957 RepID=UPI00210F9C9F|nr:uncharacterized protein LOC126035369 [Accipiter gentilis]
MPLIPAPDPATDPLQMLQRVVEEMQEQVKQQRQLLQAAGEQKGVPDSPKVTLPDWKIVARECVMDGIRFEGPPLVCPVRAGPGGVGVEWSPLDSKLLQQVKKTVDDYGLGHPMTGSLLDKEAWTNRLQAALVETQQERPRNRKVGRWEALGDTGKRVCCSTIIRAPRLTCALGAVTVVETRPQSITICCELFCRMPFRRSSEYLHCGRCDPWVLVKYDRCGQQLWRRTSRTSKWCDRCFEHRRSTLQQPLCVPHKQGTMICF